MIKAWHGATSPRAKLVIFTMNAVRFLRMQFFHFLQDTRVKNINEDLLSPNSPTGAWLNEVQLKALILQKPTFFLKSPLVAIFNRVGHSEEFVSIINQRFNLKASYCEDGLQIEYYESLEDLPHRLQ